MLFLMPGDLDKRRSTTGYLFRFWNGPISLVGCQSFNRLMNVLGALSTTEAEYMALTEACKEAVWLQRNG